MFGLRSCNGGMGLLHPEGLGGMERIGDAGVGEDAVQRFLSYRLGYVGTAKLGHDE